MLSYYAIREDFYWAIRLKPLKNAKIDRLFEHVQDLYSDFEFNCCGIRKLCCFDILINYYDDKVSQCPGVVISNFLT